MGASAPGKIPACGPATSGALKPGLQRNWFAQQQKGDGRRQHQGNYWGLTGEKKRPFREKAKLFLSQLKADIAFAKNSFPLIVFKSPFFKGGLSKEFR